jgi:hypothetical protein
MDGVNRFFQVQNVLRIRGHVEFVFLLILREKFAATLRAGRIPACAAGWPWA